MKFDPKETSNAGVLRYAQLGARTTGIDEPKTVLMRAWWNRAASFVERAREEGWPVMTTTILTKDGRTLALITVELGSSLRPDEAAVASPLPIEVEVLSEPLHFRGPAPDGHCWGDQPYCFEEAEDNPGHCICETAPA